MCNNKFIILLLSVFFMLIASQLQADTVKHKSILEQQNKVVEDDLVVKKISLFVSESEAALNNNDLKKANYKIDEAISLNTQNPWLAYRMANILNQLHRETDADRFIGQFLVNTKPSSDSYFAAALYLAKQNKLLEALAEMDKIDAAQRSPSLIESQQRIWLDYQFGLLDNLIEHDKQQAVVRLHAIESKVGNNPKLLIKLAKYWLEINDFEHSRKVVALLKRDKNWKLDTKSDYDKLIAKLNNSEKLPDLEKTIVVLTSLTKQQLPPPKLKASHAGHPNQGDKKVIKAKVTRRESLKNSYLINHVFDKTKNKNKTTSKDNVAKKNNINGNKHVLDIASVIPLLSIGEAPSVYAPFPLMLEYDQVNNKVIGAQDSRRKSIDPVMDEIESKTIVQNQSPEKNINIAPNNANAIPSLSIVTMPSEHTPLSKYIAVIILLLIGVGIGLTIKKTWHFLVNIVVKIIRKPKTLKTVDYSYFFGNPNEEIR
ncbi:MAG: hypothetical protein PSV18_14750 [Methylobacter sp.]|nr:hypothetical protein [Candidatus Methylobacter titanis]